MATELTQEQHRAMLRPLIDQRREEIISVAVDANNPGAITLDYAEFEARREIHEELRILAGIALEGVWDV